MMEKHGDVKHEDIIPAKMPKNNTWTAHHQGTLEDIGDIVILMTNSMRVNAFADNYMSDCYEFSNIRGMICKTGFVNKTRVTVISTEMGDPACMITLKPLIISSVNHGIPKAIIKYDTCATLNDDINIKDFFFCSKIYPDAVTCRALNLQDNSPIVLTDERILVANRLAGLKGKETLALMFYGGTVTTDDDLSSEVKTDILTMEPYTMARECSLYGVPFATYLEVSDHISKFDRHIPAHQRGVLIKHTAPYICKVVEFLDFLIESPVKSD